MRKNENNEIEIIHKKIIEYMQVFFENYLDELSEELKKPLKEKQ